MIREKVSKVKKMAQKVKTIKDIHLYINLYIYYSVLIRTFGQHPVICFMATL